MIDEKQAEQPVEQQDDWSKFDDEHHEPLLLSDYEHKAYLVTTHMKKEVIEPDDILSKELQLSYLDPELAFIYSAKASCAEEWRNLGLQRLSKRRLAHLLAKLALLKSVEGFERKLQSGILSLSGELGIPSGVQRNQQPQQQQMQMPNPQGLLR